MTKHCATRTTYITWGAETDRWGFSGCVGSLATLATRTNKIATRGRVLATIARDDKTLRDKYDVHYTGATTDRRGYVGWLAKTLATRTNKIATRGSHETVGKCHPSAS